MVFRLTLVSHTPPTASQDTDAVAAALLRDIGYLPGGLEVLPSSPRRRRGRPKAGRLELEGASDPPRPGSEVLESVPYRLVTGCLLRRLGEGFTVEELVQELGTSRPTVYRHLIKLRELDLITLTDEEADARRRRHGIRYGSLSKAWRFTELNAECSLERLRDLVDRLWRQCEEKATSKETKGAKLRRDRSTSRISFKLTLREQAPLDEKMTLEANLLELLLSIGYLPSWRAADDQDSISASIPYRLFKDCLLDRPERNWTVRELMAVLGTTKPTLYRHLKKLESLDLLERGLRGDSPRSSKAFRIRYGDLAKAWTFTEEHARQSLKAYRGTVEHLEGLLVDQD
jgi:DNA-binding transcriptional ArsR family regulator